jgi:hypothetical protein
MQVGERHVLAIDKPPVIQSVLDALWAGVQSDDSVPAETRKGLEEISKHGCDRLILNLRVIKAPFGETPAAIRNLGACLVGGVLVVSGQVTPSWILQIKEHSRRHSFPMHLISSFGLFFHMLLLG